MDHSQEQTFEIGSVINAKVLEIRDVGLMVELAPRVYTLLHLSRITHDLVGQGTIEAHNVCFKIMSLINHSNINFYRHVKISNVTFITLSKLSFNVHS